MKGEWDFFANWFCAGSRRFPRLAQAEELETGPNQSTSFKGGFAGKQYYDQEENGKGKKGGDNDESKTLLCNIN